MVFLDLDCRYFSSAKFIPQYMIHIPIGTINLSRPEDVALHDSLVLLVELDAEAAQAAGS